MRLHRITSQSVIGGVCAGLAEYLKISVVLIRIAFVLLAFVTGIGIPLYLLLWFLLPTENTVQSEMGYTSQEWASRGRQFGNEVSDIFTKRRDNTLRWLGAGFVFLGGLALFHVFFPEVYRWISRLNGPLVLMALGGFLIYLAVKGVRK